MHKYIPDDYLRFIDNRGVIRIDKVRKVMITVDSFKSTVRYGFYNYKQDVTDRKIIHKIEISVAEGEPLVHPEFQENEIGQLVPRKAINDLEEQDLKESTDDQQGD